MLELDTTAVVIIDIQGKLAELMWDKDSLFQNAARLVKGAKVLGLPVVWTEQNPAGLGPTLPELASLLDPPPIVKFSFSCCGEPAFLDALQRTGRNQLLLAGIETHVCVYQTALDLIARGFAVHLVTDAVSSRTAANRQLGIDRMREAGATLTSVEMALFELLKVARGDRFKEILKVVK